MQNREMKYTIGHYEDSEDGKIFRVTKIVKCDSDAQAEHEVRRLCEDTEAAGYYIRRASNEWFARA